MLKCRLLHEPAVAMAISTVDGGRLSVLISFVALFSSIFNLTVTGYAFESMAEVYTIPAWVMSAASSAGLWGSVAGMFLLGYVGDCLGLYGSVSWC